MDDGFHSTENVYPGVLPVVQCQWQGRQAVKLRLQSDSISVAGVRDVVVNGP